MGPWSVRRAGKPFLPGCSYEVLKRRIASGTVTSDTAGINIPLQFGRRRAAEAEALAKLGEIEARLAEGVDKVALEVTDAYDKLVESEHVVTLYRSKVIPSATENLEAAKSGYESSKVDFLTLITAEKNLMLVELEYEQALTAYHQRVATLERVVGGSVGETSQGDKNND